MGFKASDLLCWRKEGRNVQKRNCVSVICVKPGLCRPSSQGVPEGECCLWEVFLLQQKL